MRVIFSGLEYIGIFQIIDGEIPLILGMSFLKDMKPVIDFGGNTVRVG